MLISDLEYDGVVGSGGFAIIQRYKHKDTKMKYAVKRLDVKYHSDKDAIYRFAKEINYTKQLEEHDFIINVLGYEVNIETGTFYYIMPLSYQNLEQYINTNNSKLSFSDRLDLFEQILSAVGHAHRNNIWHRDLTPTNILTFSNADQTIINVCDFGLGKDPDSLTRNANSSVGGLGQYMYVDPAQLESLKNGNNLSDIYSLGKILYFLLTGKRPHTIEYSKFSDLIQKAIKKQFSDVFEFEADYMKSKTTYMYLETSTHLTLQEYVNKNKGNINWEEFYRYSIDGNNFDHIYSDFIYPFMDVLQHDEQIKGLLDYIGKDDTVLIEKYIDSLHVCYKTNGWPFNQMDSFTEFLLRYSQLNTNEQVQLMCLKEAWHIAAVRDQWISQDYIISHLIKCELSNYVDESFAVHLLTVNKSFKKLKRIDISSIKSIRVRRILRVLIEQ